MPTRERLGKLAIVFAVCAAVFIPVGLLARSTSDRADRAIDGGAPTEPTALPTPTPIVVPTAPPLPTPTPERATPAPTAPATNGAPAGAAPTATPAPRQTGAPGSFCDVTGRFGNEHETVATFEVPTTATAKGCTSIEPGGWEAPRPAVRISYRPNTDLVTALHEAVLEPGDDLELTDAHYAPSAVATGWRLAYEHVDASIPDRGGLLRAILRVPWRGGVVVVDSGDAAWSDEQRRQAHDLFDTVVTTLSPGDRKGNRPEPGGLCSGNEWAAPVPRDWFAYNDCHHFNTSSEALHAMACECLGPFRVFERERSRPLTNTRVRADGLRYSVTEEFRESEYIGDRDYRIIEVELPSTTLVIEATQQIDHAFPGHTWDDTVRAQDEFLANLVVADVAERETLELRVRWPAVDDRDTGTITRTPLGDDRWILSARVAQEDTDDAYLSDVSPMGLRGVVSRAASGRLSFDGTAWSRADGRNRCQVEGQDQALRPTPNGEAWSLDLPACGSEIDLIVDGLAAPIARTDCDASNDSVVGRHSFSTELDVDGDRIDEHVFVRMGPDAGPAGIEVTVRFDDGHEISSAIEPADVGVDITRGLSYRLHVLEPNGAGHELLVIDASLGELPAFALAVDPAGCAARVLAVLADDGVSRWCAAPAGIDGGVIIREWKEFDVVDRGTVAADDALLRWRGSTLVRIARAGGPPPCGPDLPAATN